MDVAARDLVNRETFRGMADLSGRVLGSIHEQTRARVSPLLRGGLSDSHAGLGAGRGLESMPPGVYTERVEAWHRTAGVAMPPVIIADQQKRWRSCNLLGTIRLNWRIKTITTPSTKTRSQGI